MCYTGLCKHEGYMGDCTCGGTKCPPTVPWGATPEGENADETEEPD